MPDAEYVQKEERKRYELAEEERLKLETEVIRRKLPRPSKIPTKMKKASNKSVVDELVEK